MVELEALPGLGVEDGWPGGGVLVALVLAGCQRGACCSGCDWTPMQYHGPPLGAGMPCLVQPPGDLGVAVAVDDPASRSRGGCQLLTP